MSEAALRTGWPASAAPRARLVCEITTQEVAEGITLGNAPDRAESEVCACR